MPYTDKAKRKEYMRAYNAQHKDQKKAYNAQRKKKRNEIRRNRYAANAAVREKIHSHNKKWEEANKEKRKARHADIRIRHITKDPSKGLVWYNGMCDRQGFLCEICKGVLEDKITGKGQTLHVDHKHGTDQVRDLLCANCNRGLGMFKDSPELLLKAAAYLRKHQLRAIQQARREYFAPVNPLR